MIQNNSTFIEPPSPSINQAINTMNILENTSPTRPEVI